MVISGWYNYGLLVFFFVFFFDLHYSCKREKKQQKKKKTKFKKVNHKLGKIFESNNSLIILIYKILLPKLIPERQRTQNF